MTVLIERHEPGCNCSYCGNSCDKGMHYGLNIPADWLAWNSWWVVKYAPARYFRWTALGWLRPNKKAFGK